MSGTSAEDPKMISDGKRMRSVWMPGEGDGDSSEYLIERSMNLIRGHPTWKIFIGNVTLPIARGSPDEPPHYVYLDDQACYVVFASKAYSAKEMRKFWPWDFNHQGHIKTGRKNRGRPAFLDDHHTEFAQAPLRGKNILYTFSGAPDVVEYKPVRPKKETRMELQVAQEIAEETTDGADSENVPPSHDDASQGHSTILSSCAEIHSPPETPTECIYPMYPPRLAPSIPQSLQFRTISADPSETVKSTHCSESTSISKSISSVPSTLPESPSLKPHTLASSTKVQHSIGKFNPKRTLSRVTSTTKHSQVPTSSLKRNITPSGDDGSPNKRSPTAQYSTLAKAYGLSFDGEDDDKHIIGLEHGSDGELKKMEELLPHPRLSCCKRGEYQAPIGLDICEIHR
ncbi:hypothetical protein CC78DRAFT_224475 [Lojkania enalia]|uniref:Uncharacterized protein n=1 Tax=Lojkania enalia TaxID=147567 RepID=A0A9P4N4F0_9PLEO|nr:hypothetical protein CC78DRAFT_224475 [Didymosphaeria enalia]